MTSGLPLLMVAPDVFGRKKVTSYIILMQFSPDVIDSSPGRLIDVVGSQLA